MGKKEFYIYKEDLIQYAKQQDLVRISQLVEDLNNKYCTDDMKKMRTTKITNYLLRQGYLYLYEERKCPTTKGKMIGIQTGWITDKSGKEIKVNLYNLRAQQYILDNFYNIIRNLE